MPEVEVKLFATLRRYDPRAERSSEPIRLELREGATIDELMDALAIRADEVKQVFVNGVRKEGDDALKEGDTVAVFPPIAGG